MRVARISGKSREDYWLTVMTSQRRNESKAEFFFSLGVGSHLGVRNNAFPGAAGADMLRSARSCIPAWSGPKCVRRRTIGLIHYFATFTTLSLQLSIHLSKLAGVKFCWVCKVISAWVGLPGRCAISEVSAWKPDTSGIKRQRSEQIRNSWPGCFFGSCCSIQMLCVHEVALWGISGAANQTPAMYVWWI